MTSGELNGYRIILVNKIGRPEERISRTLHQFYVLNGIDCLTELARDDKRKFTIKNEQREPRKGKKLITKNLKRQVL